MTGLLTKSDGMRLETVKGRVLAVECACGHKDSIAINRLLKHFSQTAKIRDVIPRLMCTSCGQRSVKKFSVLEID